MADRSEFEEANLGICGTVIICDEKKTSYELQK
jgi:hypothetical protein